MENVVETKAGLIKGTTGVDYDNEPFYCFYGIPYAKPTVGELRFKSPQLPERWEGIKDCTSVKDCCYSRHTFTAKFCGSEDCLYLNVYTKHITKTDSNTFRLPVFVWIHGGAFIVGSGNPDLFGPEFLMTQNIVIVTITYRLGPLGFLYLNDDTLGVPGNAGLKDVLMGLKWVNKNIHHFGGDPNNVTAGGQSAGAIIVHLLSMSPLSKGLFHRMILQSAAALQNWGIGKHEGAKDLAAAFGFKSECEREIFEFLRKAPVEELVRASQKVRIVADDRFADNVLAFNPVIEKPSPEAIITEPPLLKIMRGDYNKIPILMGYASDEGLYAIFIISKLKIIIEDFERMVPHTLKLQKGSELSKTIARKIQRFYFGNERATVENKDKYMRMATDFLFSYPLYRVVKHAVKNLNQPIYFYKFSLDTKLNLYKLVRKYEAPGASHGDDTCYLFKTTITPDIKPGTVEDIAVRRITRIWGNFIKNGNPNSVNHDPLIQVNWRPVESNVFHYVDIRNDGLVAGTDPDHKHMSFWDDTSIYKVDPLYQKHKL